MRLLVANFERQNIVAKSQVIQAVKRLPRAHYEGLQAIRYDPHRTFATHLSFVHQKPFSLRTMGFYYHESDLSVIIIFPFKTSSEFYHVLYHEIGHYVFLRVLSQAHRDQWFHKIRPKENKMIVISVFLRAYAVLGYFLIRKAKTLAVRSYPSYWFRLWSDEIGHERP
jgi:hypothetical protein